MTTIPTLRPSPTALLSPRIDSSFKAMFTADTKESNLALKDFISTILGKDIQEVTLMPNEPAVQVIDENQMSFDVSVKVNDEERIDLEMQARNRAYDYLGRSEIQVARLLSTNNKKGDNWRTPAAYQISVLDFSVNKNDKSPLSWYSMKDKKGSELAGKLNVIFFDLVKIRKLAEKPVEELSKIEKWGLFLSFAGDEQKAKYIDRIINTEEGIMYAKSALSNVSQDEINWARQNSIFIGIEDYNAERQYFAELKEELSKEMEGLSRERQELSREQQKISREQQKIFKGQQELAEGQEELSKGQQELSRGQQELSQQKLNFARKLLKLGESPEQISADLGLPADEIASL